MTEASDLTSEVVAARERLIEFVRRCPPERWMSSPLAGDDPRTVAVIIDHVADAYEYLASFVATLTRHEPVEVSPEIVDDLNARHAAAAVPVPTKQSAVEHLVRSGDAFVALIEPLDAHQLATGEGQVTVARFATIAARHTDTHRIELEQALDLIG
jgi:hypothetical protein